MNLEMSQDGKNWTYKTVLVGPEYAAKLLSNNNENRRIRQSSVAKYATIIAEGNWVLTPEPIVVADNGRLLNGQHRLNAIIKSGCSVPLLIISNVSESVFPALDRGVPRSTSDALGIDKKTVEVAKTICRIYYGTSTDDITDARVAKVCEFISDDHESILSCCSTSVKVMSSAPMRVAASLRLFAGYDKDYIFSTYRNLILCNLGDLSPLAQSFFAAVASGRVVSGPGKTQTTLAARAWDVFDPLKRNNLRITLREESTRLDAMKKIIATALRNIEDASNNEANTI